MHLRMLGGFWPLKIYHFGGLAVSILEAKNPFCMAAHFVRGSVYAFLLSLRDFVSLFISRISVSPKFTGL